MDSFQIIMALIGAGIILLGLFLLAAIPRSRNTKKKLDAEAKQTTGRILTGEWKRMGKQRVYVTTYEYTVDGTKLAGSRQLKLISYFPSGDIPIEYLEDTPKEHRITGVDKSGSLLNLAGLGVFGVGMIGFGFVLINNFVLSG